MYFLRVLVKRDMSQGFFYSTCCHSNLMKKCLTFKRTNNF